MSSLLNKTLSVHTFTLHILCLLLCHPHPACVGCALFSIEEKEYLKKRLILNTSVMSRQPLLAHHHPIRLGLLIS